MKNWKFKYFEKNVKESHTHIYSSLEIKNYIKKFLNNYKLTLNDFKINFSNSTVNIFLSIYNTKEKKSTPIKKKIQDLRNNFNKIKFIDFNKLKTKNKKIKIIFLTKNLLKKTENLLEKTKSFNLELKKQYKRLLVYLISNNHINNNKNKLKLNNFSKELLEGVKQFLKNKYNIILTLQKKKLASKKILKKNNVELKLRRFNKASFFTQGPSIMFTFISQANSEKLLMKFISKELTSIKRHKFFLNFLKDSFKILINQKFSKISGLKLIVTGRLNNVMRANSYVIKIGKIPLIAPCSNLIYSKMTTYGKNGTLGIKLWVLPKKISKVIITKTLEKKLSKN